MSPLNSNVSCEHEFQLIFKLYDYMSYELDYDTLENDIKHDYLSCNTGRDKQDYYWYVDELHCIAIDLQGSIFDYDNDVKWFEDIFL